MLGNGDGKLTTVLNVNADEASRFAVSQALRKAGLSVREAGTAIALDGDAGQADLILLDLHLPDADPAEVCRRLKSDRATASIPVLFLSRGGQDVARRVAGLEAGAEGCLCHPAPDEVVAHAKVLLRAKRAERRLREAGERSARLQALAAALSQAVTSGQVADTILTQGMAVLGADAGCVTLLSDDRQELILLRTAGAVPDAAAKWHRFPLDAPIPLAEALRERKVVVLETFAERLAGYPALEGVLACRGDGAVVALPMVVRGEGVGSLGWGWPTDRRFTDEDRAFLLTLAELCGQALDRARLYDAERAARERAERAEGEVARLNRDLQCRLDELQAVLKVAPVGVAIAHDPECRRITLNAYMSELLGVPAGENASLTAPPDQQPDSYTNYRDGEEVPPDRLPMQVACTGVEVRDFEVDLVRAGRDARRLLCYARPLLDAAGRIRGGVGGFLDVTDREAAERALRDSERRFRTLAGSAPAGIFETDADGNCLFVNDRWCEMAGMTPEAASGQGWAEALHPGDKDRIFREWYTAAQEGREFASEYRFRTPEGRVTWLSGSAVALRDESATITGYIGTVTDITARKTAGEALRESEQRLRAISDNLPLGAVYQVVGDSGGRRHFRYISAGVERLFGVTPAEALADATALYGLVHEEDLHRVAAQEQVALRDLAPFDCEFRSWTRSGGLIWVHARSAPRRLPTGETVWEGIVMDVDDRRRAEEELREADRRKDEFLATLAHELRNPLAPIRNGLQLLRLAGDDRATAGQAQGMMERQLAQMVRLIDDLLDVSRISRGKLHLRRGRVDLASVVGSAVENSRPLIESSAHHLTVSLPPEPTHLDADPTRLAQVFANLLTNAAKYTDKGGHIRLTAEREGGEVVVSVRDTGIGIPTEYLPRLFEMFSQVAPALERSQGGLGIGLSLVKGLVGMHGGTVEARSEGAGKGSEFVVRLPVSDGSPAPGSPPPAGGDEGTALPGRRILVADDNRDAADSLAMMLRLAGHEVHAAYDGQEAVEAASWFRPDLALLDIGMPRLTGYEVARRIREGSWGKSVVLVAVTGWGQEEDKRRATEAGFDHHLTKPVDPAALERVLSGLKKA